MTSVATRATRWTPERYFLNNDFCPPELVRDHLDRLRLKVGADWMLLLTIGPAAPLKSLTMMSARLAGTRRRFSAALARGNYLDATPDLRTDAAVASAWVTQAGILHTEETAATRLNDVSPDGDTLSVWLFTAPAVASLVEPRDLRRLAVMVNATAVAHSSRDHRVTALVRRTRRDTDDREGEVAAVPLLDIAAEVVPGAEAALYLYTPTSGELRLAARSTGSGDDYRERVATTRRLRGRDDIIRRAYVDSRTYLYPDIGVGQTNVSDSERLVAVPIPSAPYGRPHADVGVLILRRRNDLEERRDFTFVELTLVRNVALRLALEVALSRADRFGHELSRLAESIARRLRDHADEVSDPVVPVRYVGPVDLPADFEACRPDLTSLADVIQNATASNSVTMRALLPASHARGGFVLRRFVASPDARLDDAHPEIDLMDNRTPDGIRRDSVNSRVAGTGDLEYLPTPHRSPFLSVDGRGQIASEVCVPIECDGMVVGTLNLESASVHHYDSQLTAVRAFAALAGVVIGMRRRMVVSDLSDQLARIHLSFHESRRAQILFSELEEGDDADRVAKLRQLRSVVFPSQVEADGEPEVFSRSDVVVTTEDLVPHALRRDVTRSDEGGLSQRGRLVYWSSNTRAAYREAMHEVFRNINTYRSPLSPGVTIGYDFLWLGDRRFDIVSVSARAAFTPRDSYAAALYREPIDEAGEATPHLGCFTAGEIMRAVGGDVFAVVNDDGEFETRILIPSSKERP